MALATATITYDLANLVGVPHYQGTSVTATTNIPDGVVVDTDGNQVRLGSGKGTIAQDGTGEIVVWIPGVDSNPASWQTYIHIRYRDPAADRGHATRTLGPFTITTSGDLADLIEEQSVPPTYLSIVTAELDTYVDAAADSATSSAASATSAAASAALADSYIVADLNTSDGQMEALIESPTSLTAAALSATFAAVEAGKAFDPSGVTATDTADFQALVTAAAPLGIPVLIPADFTINAGITLPNGARLEGRGGTITQATNLTPIFTATSVSGIRINGVRAVGVASDYANVDGVYFAAFLRLDDVTDAKITNCTLTGFAGAGVNIDNGSDDVIVSGCTIVGPGPTYITSTTFGRGAGVRATSPGRWAVLDCDISGYAQGIVTSDGLADVRIIGNHIHDIPGQHGLYLEQMVRGVIANNLIHDTGLLGMKVQIGTAGAGDPTDIVISNNVITDVGDQGILLTNPLGGGDAQRLRRIAVVGNVVTNALGDGINANNTIGAVVADNVVTTCRVGISLTDCSKVSVNDNRIEDTQNQGISLVSVNDAEIRFNRVIDPAKANGATTEHGIHIQTTCPEVVLEGNRVTDSLGNMRYGIYFAATTGIDTLTVVGNYSTGATDYGMRFTSATAIRRYFGNDFSGTLGTVLSPPTSANGMLRRRFDTAPPTTGRWEVGEVTENRTPAFGGVREWVCVTAGTPGTWAIVTEVQGASATTAQLADITHAINTSNKYGGKVVWNTTTTKPVYANGSTAASVWRDATAATAHTPV